MRNGSATDEDAARAGGGAAVTRRSRALGVVLAVAIAQAVAACGSGDGTAGAVGADHPTPSAAPTSRDAPATPAPAATPVTSPRPAVLCVGDSLTAGHGLSPELAWPARLAERIDERGWDLDVVNAGVSGETSTGGRHRLAWVLRQHPDVAAVVIALGGNDGLRGISPELMESNLDAMLGLLAEQRPDAVVVLAGMESPPNMGGDYTAAFRGVFPRLAERHGVTLLPFLLEGVAAESALNQGDGIHPNAAGQRIVADNVWAVLAPRLAAREARRAAGGGGGAGAEDAIDGGTDGGADGARDGAADGGER